MGNNPVRGMGFLLQGFRLISRAGLRRFALVPLLINTVLFAAVIVYGYQAFEGFIDGLLPDWLSWLSWLLLPLFGLTILIITFYTFTMVANLLSAPFNSLLAERVEAHLIGKNPQEELDASWRKILRDILPTLRSELRKIGYFLVWTIPLLLLFLVPGVNVVAPFLWMGFSAWFLAVEYADYPMGNHGLFFKEQKTELKKRRWTSFGFGGAVLFMTTVPVLNFLAMPISVAGATAMWVAWTQKSEGEAQKGQADRRVW